jgi:hypothetical protein
MDKNKRILELIKSIRESFGASIAIYTTGNCYQFYEILKNVFPDSVAYYDGNHVWTKIDNRFYDITGENKINSRVLKLVEGELINNLSSNKWTDERRINEFGNKRVESKIK